jgi:hypothetical protein
VLQEGGEAFAGGGDGVVVEVRTICHEESLTVGILL